MMCAIALALIGQSRLDEDKCLGLERERERQTFRSISDGREMRMNGWRDVTALNFGRGSDFQTLGYIIWHHWQRAA